MNFSKAKFSKKSYPEFHKKLRQRVNEYFSENNISHYANNNMVIKTVFMFSLYFVPYGLMMSGIFTNPWTIFSMWVLMGIGMAGIGLSIMHDANHGAYSKNKTINNFLGYSLNFVGGSSILWKIQHNVLHHSYTNIDGMDEDISPAGVLRFSPHNKRRKIHKLQHIYAWFLYGLMTLSWVTSKEFLQLIRYRKMGLTKRQGNFKKLMTELAIWKIVYFTYALIIPLIFLPVAWWVILSGFLVMHFICGVFLASIFQSAHIMPDVNFPLPDKEGNIENNFAVHQLLTTTNYSPTSRIFSWFIGGLNYQIEHHLFPNICHVHYKKLSKIVQKTAAEYKLPYYYKKNFVMAVSDHIKMLRNLGRYDQPSLVLDNQSG